MDTIALGWAAGKDAIVAGTGWPRDGLHLVGGLLLFLAATLPARAQWRSIASWSAVLACALANEGFDVWNDLAAGGEARIGESWHDVIYTLTLPTMVLVWAHALAAHGRIRRNRPYRPVVM